MSEDRHRSDNPGEVASYPPPALSMDGRVRLVLLALNPPVSHPDEIAACPHGLVVAYVYGNGFALLACPACRVLSIRDDRPPAEDRGRDDHAAPPPAPPVPSPAALDEAIAALRWQMREWPSRAVGRALMALEAERALR